MLNYKPTTSYWSILSVKSKNIYDILPLFNTFLAFRTLLQKLEIFEDMRINTGFIMTSSGTTIYIIYLAMNFISTGHRHKVKADAASLSKAPVK